MKMGRAFLALALLVPAAMATAAGDPHTVQGVLLKADPASRTIEVSCDTIPGYMDAMVMTFAVRNSEVLKNLQPGGTVRFSMMEEGNEEFADHLEAIKVQNYEAEPTEASRLTYLHRALDHTAAQKMIPIGGLVPNFTLTDQSNRSTQLDDFKGMVVVLSFAYSRCPNPNYCFRLSNNLAQVNRRFHSLTGHSLILLTIVIEPDHDQGQALAHYADTWKADWSAWRFLTGPLADIHAIAERFGMDFWNNEGYLTHSFHTVVIDRDGRLAANLEGNQFTADQLSDLVGTVLDRPASPVINEGGD
jgi:protein SCO1/2